MAVSVVQTLNRYELTRQKLAVKMIEITSYHFFPTFCLFIRAFSDWERVHQGHFILTLNRAILGSRNKDKWGYLFGEKIIKRTSSQSGLPLIFGHCNLKALFATRQFLCFCHAWLCLFAFPAYLCYQCNCLNSSIKHFLRFQLLLCVSSFPGFQDSLWWR